MSPDGAPVVAMGTPVQIEAAPGMSSRPGRDVSAQPNAFLRESDMAVGLFGLGPYEAALASLAGMPLLSIGNDFFRTDLARPDTED